MHRAPPHRDGILHAAPALPAGRIDRRLLIAAACIAGAALAVLLLLRESGDGLEAYPHAFIAQATYDPALVATVPAPIEAPPDAPEGMQPAWRCNDPAFNDASGRPWIFPMLATGAEPPVPPQHPGLHRRPKLDSCARFRTAEAQAQLDAYSARRSP